MNTWKYVFAGVVFIVTASMSLIAVISAEAGQSSADAGIPVITSAFPKGTSIGDLGRHQTVAVYLDGTDRLYTAIMEDAVSLELMQRSFHVVGREKIEVLLAEQLQKIQGSGSNTNRMLTTCQIGKQAGADLIILGNIIFAQRQVSSNDDSGNPITVERKQVCSTLSFRFIDIAKDSCVKIVVAEKLEDTSIMEIVKQVLGELKKSG